MTGYVGSSILFSLYARQYKLENFICLEKYSISISSNLIAELAKWRWSGASLCIILSRQRIKMEKYFGKRNLPFQVCIL